MLLAVELPPSLFGLVVGQRQLGPPAQPDPLLNIVGQSCPQNFQPHFNDSAQPKLFQPHLVFEPRVGKFCDRPALSVNCFGRFGFHFLGKLLQYR